MPRKRRTKKSLKRRRESKRPKIKKVRSKKRRANKKKQKGAHQKLFKSKKKRANKKLLKSKKRASKKLLKIPQQKKHGRNDLFVTVNLKNICKYCLKRSCIEKINEDTLHKFDHHCNEKICQEYEEEITCDLCNRTMKDNIIVKKF